MTEIKWRNCATEPSDVPNFINFAHAGDDGDSLDIWGWCACVLSCTSPHCVFALCFARVSRFFFLAYYYRWAVATWQRIRSVAKSSNMSQQAKHHTEIAVHSICLCINCCYVSIFSLSFFFSSSAECKTILHFFPFRRFG